MSVVLLKYPSDWDCSICCDSYAFQGTTSGQACMACKVHNVWSALCTCHKCCRTCCPFPAQRMVSPPKKTTWDLVLKPFINVAVIDDKLKRVLNDSRRKLNILDSANGLGVVHGLLIISDDDALLKQLVELGVDLETQYVDIGGVTGQPSVPIPKELDGGTALHFAAHYDRAKCAALLVQIGADLAAKTSQGKIPVEESKSSTMTALLEEAATTGAMSFAEMAKCGSWHSIRHSMRSGKISKTDLTQLYDGKTALEWVWSHMAEWQFATKFEEDSLMAFKVMAEMKFRYGLATPNQPSTNPLPFQVGSSADGSNFNDRPIKPNADTTTGNDMLMTQDILEVFGGIVDTMKKSFQKLEEEVAEIGVGNRALKLSVEKLEEKIAQL